MDKNERTEVKNPLEKASLLSLLTFKWIFRTLLLGYKRELEESDLYSPLKEDRSGNLGERIVSEWEKEVEKCKEKKEKHSQPRLYKVLIRCFGNTSLLLGLVLAVIELLARPLSPLILGKLLRGLRDKESVANEMYYYAAAFIILPLFSCIAFHLSFQGLMHLGMKLRIACCTLMYRKILRLSTSVFESGTSVGQMVNLMSNDVNRIDYVTLHLHYIWIGPVQSLIIACLLYVELGPAAVAGLCVFVLFIPLQAFLSKKIAKLTLLSAQRTDERLRIMNEILGGVEVIKMYVWETPFSHLVEKARRKEVNAIKRYSIIEQFCLTFDYYVPRVCLFISIITYVVTGNYVTAEKVFTMASFFDIVRGSMTIAFPLSINQLIEGLTSMKRLEKFMMYTEISKPPRKIDTSSSTPIMLKNATAKWSEECKEDTLSNIELSIEAGSLVAIIGQVASGKSSLLQAMLHELPLKEGSLEVRGKVAYVSQQPWIFASSVKQNILFGQPMDRERYERTLEVCQLRQDIRTFPHGDRTVVGERGISLSGGQRARINLARAVYADADIYLLDDPLSAVDTRVGKRIVEECICGYLKNKTRVLVTHQLQYLKSADQVIVMQNGCIKSKGDVSTLESSGLDLTKFTEDENDNKEGKDSAYEERNENGTVAVSEKANKDPVDVAEMRTMGHVSVKVYASYFKASGSAVLLILMVLFLIAYQSAASGGDYFVAYWVNVEEASMLGSVANDTRRLDWQGPLSRMQIIYVYTAVTGATILLCISEMVTYYNVCMRSSKNLHAQMYRSIVRTSMHFFNTNPAGRILNRFSKDMGAVDMRLPSTIFDVVMIGSSSIAVIIIVGSVNPWLLVPVLFIGAYVYFLREFYMSTCRSVKRLEGITRSPVFDHVTATLQGLTTVRALNAEEILTNEFDNHQDLHSSAWFIFFSSSRAFGLYLEIVFWIYVSIVVTFFLSMDNSAIVGDVGLVITQTIALCGMLQWGIRQTVEVENNMTSVERILEYSRLEEEPQLDSIPGKKLPKDWPSKGLLEFKNVMLKYEPNGDYALRNVTFVVLPEEKIGIVGRTGAGKTSLISALFRLAPVEGDIVIDGVSTSTIGLHDFRSRISIIPQAPVLFAGSLRKNLDPFDEYTDEVLWQALQEVELKEIVAEMVAGLNSRVSEGGMNFSVGQRQLLCLARALVRNHKILVLDEATANVDPQTDSLIQSTVRKKFKNCSVLTIAHRLNTIMDSDKVLVMDAGRLVEYDHPYVLLQNRGYFYGMLQQTGPAMAAILTEIAKKSYSQSSNGSSSR